MAYQEITIDKTTQKIIKKIKKLSKKDIILPELINNYTITRKDLINWISKNQITSKKERFLFESLSAALLSDFNNSFAPKAKTIPQKKPSHWKNKLKFWLLLIAGVIFFGCEGFDGITAMLSITSLPFVLTFCVGVVFSFLSIAIFLLLDLMAISTSLGFSLKHAPQGIDIYCQEIDMIKSLRKKINSTFSTRSKDNIELDIELLNALIEKYNQLEHSRQDLKNALNDPKLKIAKLITTTITGVIFFSGGFYAGQTVAFAIAALFGITMGVTSPMILILSISVGIAALFIYWFVERPGAESLVGQCIGLDSEKINKLTNEEYVNNDLANLINLKNSLLLRMSDLETISTQKEEIDDLSKKLASSQIHSPLSFYAPIENKTKENPSSPCFNNSPNQGQGCLIKNF